jgi:hypothetical protein
VSLNPQPLPPKEVAAALDAGQLAAIYRPERLRKLAKDAVDATVAKLVMQPPPPSRLAALEVAQVKSGALTAPELATLSVSLKKVGLNWSELFGDNDGVGNTSYEELTCVGLDNNAGELVAAFRVKLPTGFSGAPCTAGSTEYVAFWADWNDDCRWEYVGTAKVNTHDFVTMPAGGLAYAATLPIDLNLVRRDCEKPRDPGPGRAVVERRPVHHQPRLDARLGQPARLPRACASRRLRQYGSHDHRGRCEHAVHQPGHRRPCPPRCRPTTGSPPTRAAAPSADGSWCTVRPTGARGHRPTGCASATTAARSPVTQSFWGQRQHGRWHLGDPCRRVRAVAVWFTNGLGVLGWRRHQRRAWTIRLEVGSPFVVARRRSGSSSTTPGSAASNLVNAYVAVDPGQLGQQACGKFTQGMVITHLRRQRRVARPVEPGSDAGQQRRSAPGALTTSAILPTVGAPGGRPGISTPRVSSPAATSCGSRCTTGRSSTRWSVAGITPPTTSASPSTKS